MGECDGALPPGVQWVRVVWVDSAGIRRCRVVPAARWAALCDEGVRVTRSCMAMQCHVDAPAPGSGLDAVGEVALVPDTSTLCAGLPWRPTHAMVLGGFVEESGRKWSYDPRAALAGVLAALHFNHGMTLRLGFENEFTLLIDPRRQATGSSSAPAPGSLPASVDCTLYAQTGAVERSADVLDAMACALQRMRVPVEQYHAESAPGQFEIVTTHFEATQAVDNLILSREAITCVAMHHGLVASFLPKLVEEQAGNGCHCHFSLWEDEKNVMSGTGGRDGLSERGESFVAGVLAHLPALLPFMQANVSSYQRMQPGCWVGAFCGWADQNKEAPLRMAGRRSDPSSTNFEFKVMDATCNPYLAVAALATAGSLGLQLGLKLPEPLDGDPSTMEGAQRLPETLGDALAAFQDDTLFNEALRAVVGADLIKAYLAVKCSEEREFSKYQVVEDLAKLLYDKF